MFWFLVVIGFFVVLIITITVLAARNQEYEERVESDFRKIRRLERRLRSKEPPK